MKLWICDYFEDGFVWYAVTWDNAVAGPSERICCHKLLSHWTDARLSRAIIGHTVRAEAVFAGYEWSYWGGSPEQMSFISFLAFVQAQKNGGHWQFQQFLHLIVVEQTCCILGKFYAAFNDLSLSRSANMRVSVRGGSTFYVWELWVEDPWHWWSLFKQVVTSDPCS